ncbi:TPR repeat protein 39B [Intoshia linei]|uniref:TPR repeat protein 39B n=1 Tax=Intoshia linei TaxID=1819745 RepID=A0A177B9A6_9BILA|nr:TPR repeat protein 39B [Intoshia linei]
MIKPEDSDSEFYDALEVIESSNSDTHKTESQSSSPPSTKSDNIKYSESCQHIKLGNEKVNYPLEISQDDKDFHFSQQEAYLAIHSYFNNEYEKSLQISNNGHSMYHRLINSYILYLQAGLTVERTVIVESIEAVNKALEITTKMRPKKISKIITEQEAHAELCYAELLMEQAFLSFMEDENLVAFVKGAYRIKKCIDAIKNCLLISDRVEWRSQLSKDNFNSGLWLGHGCYLLLVSLLPNKVLRLFKFIGIRGDKLEGLNQIITSARMIDSIRGIFSAFIYILYEVVSNHQFGYGSCDVEKCREILKLYEGKCSQGAIFLFCKARIELTSRHIEKAIRLYYDSLKSQNTSKSLHCICYWELMWIYSLRCDWFIAVKFADRLVQFSSWSKITYCYLEAIFLLQSDDQSQSVVNKIKKLMEYIPLKRRKIAGKSIPSEKFIIQKTERHNSGSKLPVPAIEMMYLWNQLEMIKDNSKLIDSFLNIIKKERKLNDINDKYYYDNLALLDLLTGVCLRLSGDTHGAKKYFISAATGNKKITDTYIAPYSLFELAKLYLQDDTESGIDQAYDCYNQAAAHSNFALQSRLFFRMKAFKTKLEL